MYFKLHQQKDREVLAVCDEDLIGKTLEDKKYCIKVSETFYKGEKITEEQLAQLLRKAKNINLIGKRCVAVAIKEKLIEKNNVIKIKGIPHAQLYLF